MNSELAPSPYMQQQRDLVVDTARKMISAGVTLADVERLQRFFSAGLTGPEADRIWHGRNEGVQALAENRLDTVEQRKKYAAALARLDHNNGGNVVIG
jgi:hypothetical protein